MALTGATLAMQVLQCAIVEMPDEDDWDIGFRLTECKATSEPLAKPKNCSICLRCAAARMIMTSDRAPLITIAYVCSTSGQALGHALMSTAFACVKIARLLSAAAASVCCTSPSDLRAQLGAPGTLS